MKPTHAIIRDMTLQSGGSRELVFRSGDLPIRVGWFRGKSQKTPIPYSHAEIEFQLIVKGEGQYFIRNTVHAFQRKTVLIIPHDEVHHYLPHPDTVTERFNLIFSPRLLAGRSVAIRLLRRLRTLRVLQLSEQTAAAARFRLSTIAEECRTRQAHWEQMAINDMEQFLVILSRTADAPTSGPVGENPLIGQVVKHLELHAQEPVSLVEVARYFHLSACTLSREFRKYTGIGFKRFVLHQRVVRAKSLLAETDTKIIAIAHEIGFDDLSTFNRAFRLLVGIPPSDYRKISR